jgi:transcriptional regulator with XRE-family HTH domain
MNIGEILKEARIKKGLSVIEVARALGIDRTTYFRYENNQVKNIPIQNLLKLADMLDIDLNEMKIK